MGRRGGAGSVACLCRVAFAFRSSHHATTSRPRRRLAPIIPPAATLPSSSSAVSVVEPPADADDADGQQQSLRPSSSRPLSAPASFRSVYALTAGDDGRALEKALEEWGEKPYRARQVREWVRDGVTDFNVMSNLPKSLREKLAASVTSEFALDLVAEQISPVDGTVKRAYRLGDGQIVESVLMRYEDGRNTACVSSQAGCAMGCVFCATGQMGFKRQLTAEEIFEQAARFDALLRKQRGEKKSRLSRVVMMGMGEPLHNYRAVSKALHLFRTELGIGSRRVTVSTVGVVPGIKKLAADHPNVGLAISLHAATDDTRSALLPANSRYGGLDALMTAARDHREATGRRVTFEWALVRGQNDDAATARGLGDLLRRYDLAGRSSSSFPSSSSNAKKSRRDAGSIQHGRSSGQASCRVDTSNSASHVNVIPLNPTDAYDGQPSSPTAVDAFIDVLQRDYGVSATVRVRRGIDIDAGCGQLANKILTLDTALVDPSLPESEDSSSSTT